HHRNVCATRGHITDKNVCVTRGQINVGKIYRKIPLLRTISIAHPKFRGELEKAAFERNLIPRYYFVNK
ncbi:MAG: hypothetical protein ACK4NF_06795, partial [Planctomycetota bacterium]